MEDASILNSYDSLLNALSLTTHFIIYLLIYILFILFCFLYSPLTYPFFFGQCDTPLFIYIFLYNYFISTSSYRPGHPFCFPLRHLPFSSSFSQSHSSLVFIPLAHILFLSQRRPFMRLPITYYHCCLTLIPLSSFSHSLLLSSYIFVFFIFFSFLRSYPLFS